MRDRKVPKLRVAEKITSPGLYRDIEADGLQKSGAGQQVALAVEDRQVHLLRNIARLYHAPVM